MKFSLKKFRVLKKDFSFLFKSTINKSKLFHSFEIIQKVQKIRNQTFPGKKLSWQIIPLKNVIKIISSHWKFILNIDPHFYFTKCWKFDECQVSTYGNLRWHVFMHMIFFITKGKTEIIAALYLSASDFFKLCIELNKWDLLFFIRDIQNIL